jgi:isopentenyldiphosphate isomerase
MPEILDIVSENDDVIGQDTRVAVHEQHAIHRGVHLFIVNNKGELLVQQRASDKEYYPGYFDASVGAQVISGETYEEAARREAREELGIELGELVEIAKYKSFSERQREIRTLFVTQHEGPFKTPDGEVKRIEFLSLDDIALAIRNDSRKFTEGFKKSFEHYRAFISSDGA